MTYELAKKLKDAGFPQKTEGDYIAPDGEVIYSGDWDEYNTEDCVSLPSLSELIEACPKEVVSANRNRNKEGKEYAGKIEHLFRLGYCGEENEPDVWFAGYRFYESVAENESGWVLDYVAPTPEEAVASLWLALHAE